MVGAVVIGVAAYQTWNHVDSGATIVRAVAETFEQARAAAAPGNDRATLVVHRGERCFVILNLFPYNPGHLMVCPYRHVADLTELEQEELRELTDLTRTAVATIRSVASPHAFNVGINLGAAAGGSLSGHLHQHVVPRWNGDANFMPVLAGTKAIMQTLGDTRQDIADAWPAA